MSSEIGYGPCAGFLMQANLAHALPTSAAPRTAAAGSGETRAVNPITGQLEPSAADLAAEAKALAAMSEEQKEQEAERLFTLFDRLNKTGVVNVKNPVREARESGRFVEIDEREEERRRKEEDEEEKRLEEEVEREMGQYRARKGRG
jgi:ABC-type branched-subunit amino acid transport system ATPase component